MGVSEDRYSKNTNAFNSQIPAAFKDTVGLVDYFSNSLFKNSEDISFVFFLMILNITKRCNLKTFYNISARAPKWELKLLQLQDLQQNIKVIIWVVGLDSNFLILCFFASLYLLTFLLHSFYVK